MPSTENTPLKAVGAAAENLRKTILFKENKDKALQELAKLGEAAERGDFSIRSLALLGGIATVVTSLLGLLGRFLTLHWMHLVIDVYLIILCLFVLFLEGKQYYVTQLPPTITANIRKYAYFLEFTWGRGYMYFFIGSLQMSEASIVDLVVGGYMCFVGVTYIAVGRRTAHKLSELRKNMYSERQLRKMFSAVTNCNVIDCEQFRNLLQQFGLVLSLQEAEASFLQIPKSVVGDCIDFKQFSQWWTTAEFDTDQNSQFALSV